jgi:hypothetical protein
MVTSFKDLTVYIESPIAQEIIKKLRDRKAQELIEEKKRARAIISELLTMEEWSTGEEEAAVKAAITLAASRYVIDNGNKSRIGTLENEIINNLKRTQREITDVAPLLHPDFVYTHFMTDDENLRNETKKRHAEIQGRKLRLLAQIKERDSDEYARLKGMIDDLNELLKVSAIDEAKEKEDLNLITQVQVRVKDITRYFG